MAEPTDEAADLAALARSRPDVVGLARLASVATIVEPALLRRLRLEVGGRVRAEQGSGKQVGGWHAGTEADLWFSDLAHTATASQLTLRPAVLAVLRGQLAEPAHRASALAARQVVIEVHARHSDMVRLEERIIWASLTGDLPDVGEAFERALSTLTRHPDRAPEVVRWFLQARRRLPPSTLAHPTGRRLLAAVAMHVDRVIAPEILAGDCFPDGLADLAPLGLPVTEVGVQVVGEGLRFVPPAEPDAGVLTLPDTRPLALEVSWQDAGGADRATVVRAEVGTSAALTGLTGAAVVRTIAGRRYRITSARSRRVVVALFGTVAGWEELADGEISRRITARLSLPDVLVQLVREPADVYVRPEVLVVGATIDTTRSWPALERVAEGMARAVMRTGLAAAEAPVAALDLSYGDAKLLEQRVRPALRWLDLIAAWGSTDIAAAVAAAVDDIARNPVRLYTLDVPRALAVLQSVALAFHTRHFWQELSNPADEQRLFGLPPGEEYFDLADPVSAAFSHVRGMCEWIFAGPVREYLAGGDDPTQVPVEPGGRWSAPIVDQTGRGPTDVGWSPDGVAWTSFAAYLSWFVGQWQVYNRTVRDGLGAGLVHNRYSVTVDDLECVRLAVGTAALPPGGEELVPPSHYRSDAEDAPAKCTYLIERAQLPSLIASLAAPVLAEVAAEVDRRAARSVPSPVTAPNAGELIVVVDRGTDGGELRWALRTAGDSAGAVTLRTAPYRPELVQVLARVVRDDLFSALPRLSEQMASLFPYQFWEAFARLGVEAADTPPTVTFVTDVDLPWELAEVPARESGDLPPLLGCRAAVAQMPTTPLPLQRLAVSGRFVVAEPDYAGRGTSTPPLRRVEVEVTELVRRYRAGRLPGGRRDLLRALETDDDIGVLDLGGHGVDSRGAEGRGLLLADGTVLTPSLLAGTRLASAPLVVLGIDGSSDLAMSFIRAGAAAVVAAMWPVSDRTASQFARRFYRGVLDEGVPPAEMLRQIRCEYRRSSDIDFLAYRYFGPPTLIVLERGYPA